MLKYLRIMEHHGWKTQRENDNQMFMFEESGEGYMEILYSVTAKKFWNYVKIKNFNFKRNKYMYTYLFMYICVYVYMCMCNWLIIQHLEQCLLSYSRFSVNVVEIRRGMLWNKSRAGFFSLDDSTSFSLDDNSGHCA